MSQNHLAEFEEIVLLTVSILDGNAYGLSIIEEIDKRINRRVSLGAIQTVLKRLEEKKFLKSEFGEATKIRGGKRKRYYSITGEGRFILKRNKRAANGLMGSHSDLFSTDLIMKLQQNPEPPALMLQLFRWFCKPELVEEIEGDLVEQYQLNHQLKGSLKAKLLFAKEVALLFRPAIYGNVRTLFSKQDISAEYQRAFWVLSLMFITPRLLGEKYKNHALLLTALVLLSFESIRLFRLRIKDQIAGTEVFKDTLRGMVFRVMVLTVFFVAYYWVLKFLIDPSV